MKEYIFLLVRKRHQSPTHSHIPLARIGHVAVSNCEKTGELMFWLSTKVLLQGWGFVSKEEGEMAI